jgi:hypothetical protein
MKPIKILFCLAFLLPLVFILFMLASSDSSFPTLPLPLSQDIPADCRQIVLVLAASPSANRAELWLMERGRAGAAWKSAAGPLPATLGKNGLGWGHGLHRCPPPSGFPIKLEGDKRSPAGLFAIPFAFGIPSEEEAAHLRLSYVHLTKHTVGVDDATSKYYNQVVDDRRVLRDWMSHEAMNRHTTLYQWGAFIAHNPQNIPGLGSCIFFHLTPRNGHSTAGCTALSADDLQTLLRWLDAEKNPLLLQTAVP